VLVVGAVLLAWIVTLDRMRGMDAGPGTGLGPLGWFLGIWVTMMAAMMLPSAAPMALIFARTAGGRIVPVLFFVSGYLATWLVYGLGAYGLYRLVDALGSGVLAWDRAGPFVAGGAVAGAGLYELTPLKAVCLRHCRTPFQFLRDRWRDGAAGAGRMGVEHGAYCVGCCWGLMFVLFAVGVMSIFWMALLAAVIFAEKVLPYGERFTKAVAVGLVALGIWIAAAPSSVPGLTQPAPGGGMQMNKLDRNEMGPSKMQPQKLKPKKMME